MNLSTFDQKAKDWDKNPTNIERAEKIAESIEKQISLEGKKKALEFGAGTALLSLYLKNHFDTIVLLDESTEMVKIMESKKEAFSPTEIHPVQLNLEMDPIPEGPYQFVFSQMTLHHIKDINLGLKKFYDVLESGGVLAIADLYKEDGSFHGSGFDGHNGFDIDKLTKQFQATGFKNVSHVTAYEMSKTTESGEIRVYPIFLIFGEK